MRYIITQQLNVWKHVFICLHIRRALGLSAWFWNCWVPSWHWTTQFHWKTPQMRCRYGLAPGECLGVRGTLTGCMRFRVFPRLNIRLEHNSQHFFGAFVRQIGDEQNFVWRCCRLLTFFSCSLTLFSWTLDRLLFFLRKCNVLLRSAIFNKEKIVKKIKFLCYKKNTSQ